MLYFAEVKQTKGFIGGLKTELKLLACQGNDQNWSILPKETTIVAEEANNFGDGALVVVNLNENQEIKGKIEPAAGKVVNILQSFSRLLSKSKDQEQEMDQWRQSLTIQLEELSRREMELQERLEVGFPVDLSEEFQEKINIVKAAFDNQQANLDNRQEQLEQQRTALGQRQEEVNRQGEELKSYQARWQQSAGAVEEAKIQLQVKQNLLKSKHESLELLNLELRTKEELRERISRLAIESGNVELEQKIDINALESMPLGELQEIVNKLKKELEKIVRFVNEQEEELTLQCQTIQELEDRVHAASEYDRLSLEQELAEEQERKEFLDKTLVGQRRTLRERQEIFKQHMRILERRQGIISSDWEDQVINLKPILNQLKNQQNNLQHKRVELEAEIKQIQQSFEQAQKTVEQQEGELEAKKKELQEQEENWQQARIFLAQLQSQIKIYEETLQPLQAELNEAREKFEALEQLFDQT
ncbi:MAG: pilus motility taxis protein HmpF [Prochloraceae cyanobacterium]